MTETNIDLSPFITQITDEGLESKPNGTNYDTSPYRCTPFHSSIQFFSDLAHAFTPEFISWIGIVQFFIGGGTFQLVMNAALPLFKDFGIDASRKQLYIAAMHSPMAMKPFVGVLSDLVPIRGYHKKYYSIIAILVGCLSCSILVGFFQNGQVVADIVSQGEKAVNRICDVIVMCFCAMSAEYATLDILMEGKYSELMKEHPQSGPSIVTYKMGMFKLGEILTQTYVGPLSDTNRWNIIFWIALVLTAMPFFPTLKGWLMEDIRVADELGMVKPCRGVLFDKSTFNSRRTLFVAVFLSGLASPLASAVTIFANLEAGLIFSSFVLAGLLLSTYLMFPRITFWTVLAIVIIDLSFVDINSALEYFYTADDTCLPNGPNFHYTYFITMSGIVGASVNFIAVIMYQSFMSNWKIRDTIIFAIVIGSFANVADLVIVMRWNRALGIPDKVFFLMGSAVFQQVTYIMLSIPKFVLISKVTPPRMESTVFAFVVGITNFCYMLARLIGAGVIQQSGIITVGSDCDFGALPSLIIIFNILLPIKVGIPASFLIRNVLQSEQYLDWEVEGWNVNEQTGGNAQNGSINKT